MYRAGAAVVSTITSLICKEILKWKVVPSTDLVEQIEIAMTLLGRLNYRIEIIEFFCENSQTFVEIINMSEARPAKLHG